MGLTLNWRIGPSGAAFTDTHFVTLAQAGGQRARLPLSPVHLRGRLNISDDVEMSWIRRGRINADDWEGTDIPLGEEQEAYEIEIFSTVGELKRTASATNQDWLYENAMILADFGAVPVSIDVSVRQIGTNARGIARTRRLDLS